MAGPRPRVFISSLMQGYGDVRRDAAEAIRRADCDPVRAEDFPAAGTSPRSACLDGVASCDAVVFILGNRYISPGSSAVESGLSATHEEYNEAVQRRKQIFLFLDYRSDDPIETAQDAFIKEVTGYVGGHWRKSFRTLDELGDLIETALKEAPPLAGTNDAASSTATRLQSAFDADLPRGDHEVLMQITWATLREEEVVDPLVLTDPHYEDQIQSLAHSGGKPLFSFRESKESSASVSRLRIVQGDPHDRGGKSSYTTIDLYENGTLLIAAAVTGNEGGSSMGESWAAMHYIDPDYVAQRLQQAWSFAARWWDDHDKFLRHASMDYNVALHGVGRRRFGKPAPQYGGSYSFTAPSRDTPDPLWVYDRPRRISRHDLRASEPEIGRIMKMLEHRLADKQRS